MAFSWIFGRVEARSVLSMEGKMKLTNTVTTSCRNGCRGNLEKVFTRLSTRKMKSADPCKPSLLSADKYRTRTQSLRRRQGTHEAGHGNKKRLYYAISPILRKPPIQRSSSIIEAALSTLVLINVTLTPGTYSFGISLPPYIAISTADSNVCGILTSSKRQCKFVIR